MPDAPRSAQAIRARRSRLHNRGDHSECLPTRDCFDPATAGAGVRASRRDATRDGARDASRRDEVEHPTSPPGLRDRGVRLWEQMTGGAALGPMHLVLLEEACRIADRLDRLDEHLGGRPWLDFIAEEAAESGAVEILVKVDRVLGESRMQAVALRNLITEIRSAGRGAKHPPLTAGTRLAAAGGRGSVTDLQARMRERQQRAASAD